VFGVGSVVGVAAMIGATAGLREAHLYRQRTNEGLKFELVGLLMFAANVLLFVAAWAATRLSVPAFGSPRRRGFLVAAVVLVIGVVAGDVFFLWVESHGDRCIGSCG
jgi:uncharacterized membrane protein (DUF485 family)